MTDVPKTRTRRTPEQRAAWHQAQANRARASAAKQTKSRDTRGQVLLAVALVKRAEKVHPKQELYGILRAIARMELSPADFEALDSWWCAKGYPMNGE